MRMLGANPEPQVSGMDALPGKSNYFIGRDPAKWRTNIAHYARVKYGEVYPGIDLVYYGTNQRQLEYDFVVAPGADPRAIKLEFTGAEKVSVDEQGELVLGIASGEVRQHKPIIYQEMGGERREVAGRYVLKGGRKVGFEVGEYDARVPLVIDPVLVYSTFIGGVGSDFGTAIAVDSGGSAYITGRAIGIGYPTTDGAYQTVKADPVSTSDVVVTKLNAAGAALDYSTYIGGSGSDFANDIALEPADARPEPSSSVYITGATTSVDFPTPNGFDTTRSTNSDAFIAKLSAEGAELLYSTYLGGNNADVGKAIAADSNGGAYVAGETLATITTGFSSPGAFQTSNLGGKSGFVAKFNTTASGADSRVYSTYLGGSSSDEAEGIAIDSDGNAYVTGETFSTNFPVAGEPFQGQNAGSNDAFVAKLSADGRSLTYSTYLGGTGSDEGRDIALEDIGDNVFHIHVMGRSSSADFPLTDSAYQKTNRGGTDVFLTKLSPSQPPSAQLLYSTYFGGSLDDLGESLALDAGGNAYVVGNTGSEDLPLVSPLQAHNKGPQGTDLGGDGFVAKLNPGDGTLNFSTYLSGTSNDELFDVAVYANPDDPSCSDTPCAYVTGTTLSPDFPVVVGSYQTTLGGNSDIFVTKFTPSQGAGHFISGRVTDRLGNRLSGVTLTLDDGRRPLTTTTASNGTYSFVNLPPDASYTLTPSKRSYTFTPASRDFPNLNADQTGIDFVGAIIVASTNDGGEGSLRQAIIDANTTPGRDTIELPAGVYTLNIDGRGEDAAATGDLDITDTLTLVGEGANTTIIDGGGSDRVLHILSANVEISGVTVRNGNGGDEGGGGIRVEGSAAAEGELSLTDAAVTGNTTAGDGGGIFNVAGFDQQAQLILSNVTVSGNTANRGGGIANLDAGSGNTFTFATNLTVSGNTGGAQGGGVFNASSQGVGYASVELVYATISNNTSASGGGIANVDLDPASNNNLAEFFIGNTIIANSPSGGNCAGVIDTELYDGHNLDSGNTCNLDPSAALRNISNADPRLGPLADNGGPTQTHALLAGSPAIDAGLEDLSIPTDQRGVARPQGNAYDIGAFEFEVFCTPPPAGMAAWLPGDGDASDISGNNNNGTLVNGAGFADGKVGQAFSFDGVDDFVRVADAPSLDITSQITIDAWIKPVALGGRIVDKITSGGADGYLLDTHEGRLRLIINDQHLSSTQICRSTRSRTLRVFMMVRN